MFLDSLPRPFLVLAPMDDVTDTVFRQIVAGCARPDLMFTEFVNVDGLQSPGREHLLPKLKLAESENPVIAQLWGLNPENFYKTTKEIIKMGYAGVDLNMGCPVKTVIKNGACAALMNNRELAQAIIDATKKAAGRFPVSVKTRLGFADIDASWIEFLLKQKLGMLSVHGRTVKQMSKVPADWPAIGELVKMRGEISPSTLIVGNGDVMSRREAESLAGQYNLDGIMIGRGVFHDPYIFAQASPWEGYGRPERLGLFAKHIELHQKTYKDGERKFEPLRKFCKVYINGFDGAAELRGQFMQAQNAAGALQLLKSKI